MNGRFLMITFLIFVLVSLSSLTFLVREVEASETIYIRSDGLVFPSDAPISRDGNVYTLTGHINGSIVVQKNNIVIDGAEIYTIYGLGDFDSIGIDLTGRSNITIRNVKEIKQFGYGVLLNMSSNIFIFGNVLSANIRGGIYLSQTSNSTIYRNNMTANMNYDVKLYQSSDNKLYENSMRRILLEYNSNNNSVYRNDILVSGQEGVGLGWSANNNVISGNSIRGGLYGVHVFYASSQKILGNNITENNYGIYLDSSSSNVMSRNTVKNTTFAIFLISSSENTIFHNNFLDYEQILVSDSHLNLWDYGLPFGGNYWSNYTGVDSNDDGIGDSSHVLDGENRDNYPLMGIFSSFNTSLAEYVNVLSNSTVETFGYFENNSTIRILVSNMTAGQTFGFCRVCIPHVLISENYNVTVNGANPIQWNYTLYDNKTHRWIYFVYEHSTLKIVIIPEFPSHIVLSLFMIVSVLVVTIHKISMRLTRASFKTIIIEE